MSGTLAAVTALAVGAIRAGRRALVRSTFDLAADFAQAEATGARRDFVQQLTRVDLLVLEDFGMKKLGASAAEDLLEIFVRRHEAGSTLITTNRPTQDWGAFLGGVPAATAILDRFSRTQPLCKWPARAIACGPAPLRSPRDQGRGRCRRHGRRERAHRALEIAARFPQAPTALSSGDDFKNGQKTPCLRTARTYAILTAPAAGWFSNVR
jgi:hypothetical protein